MQWNVVGQGLFQLGASKRGKGNDDVQKS